MRWKLFLSVKRIKNGRAFNYESHCHSEEYTYEESRGVGHR